MAISSTFFLKTQTKAICRKIPLPQACKHKVASANGFQTFHLSEMFLHTELFHSGVPIIHATVSLHGAKDCEACFKMHMQITWVTSMACWALFVASDKLSTCPTGKIPQHIPAAEPWRGRSGVVGKLAFKEPCLTLPIFSLRNSWQASTKSQGLPQGKQLEKYC